MKQINSTKRMVTAALFAALTCIATMVIRIPTPAMGYIHPGDTLVILCGVLLGPLTGGLAAGIGSMMADLFSGYAVYAIPTLIIKGISAAAAGVIFLSFSGKNQCVRRPSVLIGGLASECIVVGGYFLFSVLQTLIMTGSMASGNLIAALSNAALGIPANLLQGAVGIALSCALFPLLAKSMPLQSH